MGWYLQKGQTGELSARKQAELLQRLRLISNTGQRTGRKTKQQQKKQLCLTHFLQNKQWTSSRVHCLFLES
jgi:hypothetical protein